MWSAHLFLKKWANPGLFFVYFCSLLVTISKQIEKNHRWCAWDSNPGPQDGGRRRNHGAMITAVSWHSRHKSKFMEHFSIRRYIDQSGSVGCLNKSIFESISTSKTS